ncbi:unnamed protein product [Thelazia callipaeda]|uniref:protein acetyllysine N-acetyltransferase n=1 Tax=Thelazia callipaeda TaxID=103827 RepID=A0A0N5CYQ8_THECL|nr:unnamed protein product [Thelazia callipaeda]
MKRADRLREVEESDDVVTKKCEILADILKKSKCTIVYTGAGISTAASIPDYRGPNGVWTLAEKGIVSLKCADPIQSEPTASHMILKEMCRKGLIRHVLSQNCDGLHLRSGLPQKMLSEIHGNMHIEVCQHCEPPRQYIRPYDVTEKSQFRRHGTGRMCEVCNNELADTIVHFGEAGKVPWPLNWNGIIPLISKCDVILCIGTSLTVLKEYSFLWPKSKSNTQIAIVNLQWTPKDRVSCLKINAKCDTVMKKLANIFEIDTGRYCRNCDPVLNPKRSARIWEIRERLTDCTCRNREPRSVVQHTPSKSIPASLPVNSRKRQCSSNSQHSNLTSPHVNLCTAFMDRSDVSHGSSSFSNEEKGVEVVNKERVISSDVLNLGNSVSEISEPTAVQESETTCIDQNVNRHHHQTIEDCLNNFLLSLRKERNPSPNTSGMENVQ